MRRNGRRGLAEDKAQELTEPTPTGVAPATCRWILVAFRSSVASEVS